MQNKETPEKIQVTTQGKKKKKTTKKHNLKTLWRGKKTPIQ